MCSVFVKAQPLEMRDDMTQVAGFPFGSAEGCSVYLAKRADIGGYECTNQSPGSEIMLPVPSAGQCSVTASWMVENGKFCVCHFMLIMLLVPQGKAGRFLALKESIRKRFTSHDSDVTVNHLTPRSIIKG